MTNIICGPTAIEIKGADNELLHLLNFLFSWDITLEKADTSWAVTITDRPPPLSNKTVVRVPVEFDEMGILHSITPRVIEILSTNGLVAIYPEVKEAEIFNPCPRGRFIDTYRLIRQLMVCTLMQMGFSCIHAATISRNGQGFSFVGDKGSGKTSIVAHLAAVYEYDLVSNDKLFIRPDGVGVHFPEAPSVTIQTLRSLPHLRDRIEALSALSPKASEVFLDHPPLPLFRDLETLPQSQKIFFSENEFAILLRTRYATSTLLSGIGSLNNNRFGRCTIEPGININLESYRDSLDLFHDWTGLRERLREAPLAFNRPFININPANTIAETAATVATYLIDVLDPMEEG